MFRPWPAQNDETTGQTTDVRHSFGKCCVGGRC
jgi:hypothetical protein